MVFEDADVDAAAHGAVAGSLINSGQDCTAATRAIVHRSVYREFVDEGRRTLPGHPGGPAG